MTKKILVCAIILGVSLMICSMTLAKNTTMFTAEAVNVYASPSLTSNVSFKIGKAYEVEIINDTNEGWYEIRFNNRSGYVEKPRLCADDPFIAEINVKKLRFGTWREPKLKKNEVWIPTLYSDKDLSAVVNIADECLVPQRVVILENGKKAKKIAMFGQEVYVPAKDMGSISTKYNKSRDYSALEQYALTLRANAYKKALENNPNFVNIKYDAKIGKCSIGFKKGTTPSLLLMPGFKLVEYAFSQSDTNAAIKIIDTIAAKYELVKEKDYLINIFKKPIITVTFIDDAGAYMERFYDDLVSAGVDPGVFVLDLMVA